MIFGPPQRLTHFQAQFTSVVFSPDSQYIAFACLVRRRCAIGLLERSSGKKVLLAGPDNGIDDGYYHLQFSHDGTFLIACAVEEDGALSHVSRIEIATKTQTRLTYTPSIGVPSLSPDGRYVAFEARNDFVPDLFRVRVADGQLTRLTDTRAEPGFVELPHAVDYPYRFAKYHPCYSPDGEFILYLSTFYDGKPEQPRQICRLRADGSDPTRVTAVREGNVDKIIWHPDGRQVAFTLQHDLDEEHKARRKLWKYRSNLHLADTGKPTPSPYCNLEESNSVNQIGSFHPSGRYLAYSSSCEERYPEGWRNWDIHILDLETGDVTALTNDDIYDTNPLFSPDRTALLFVSERDNPVRDTDRQDRSNTGGGDLYLIDLQTTLAESVLPQISR